MSIETHPGGTLRLEHIFRVGVFAASFAGLVLVFQNCGGDFYINTQLAVDSQFEEPGGILDSVSGAKLYSQHCAACHQDLLESEKLGRSATAIFSAITTIPEMKHLSLSSSQVDEIAAALNPQGSSQTQFYQCQAPDKRGLAEKGFRKMTRPELINTLRDLTDPSIVSDGMIQARLETLGDDKMNEAVTDVPESPSDSYISAMLDVSARAADLVMANPTVRNKVFGTCSGRTVDETCARNFIRDFGLKVFRRPVTSAESQTLLAHYNIEKGIEGLKSTFQRMLLSPEMALHMEFGSKVEGERIRLTDYEIASRLSYRLSATMPDAELFAAAAQGQLQDLANVRRHAKRIVTETDAGRAKVADLFRFYLLIDKFQEPYAPAGALNSISVSGLKSEYINEAYDYINNVIWTKSGSFEDLFTSREVFPRSERMARILATTQSSGGTPSLTTADHAGLLLRPGMLANAGSTTKPYHRAAIIRKRLLCEVYHAPDPDAITTREGELGDLSSLSNRERLTALTDIPQCLTCHASLNPVAFALEGYDQLGMRRDRESIFDSRGNFLNTVPIDTRVSEANLQGPNGIVNNLDGAIELNSTIGSSTTARACFAKTIFEFQRRRVMSQEDRCALHEVEKATGAGGTVVDAFIVGVANEDIFWKGME